MSVANKKTKLSALLIATLMTANFVCADAYKNNVLDVKVNKEAGNAVKVTIYTDKPYTDPVVVNKKANNKYVILMPETKSSLKGAPTVNSSDGTVSNVSVNTQDVAGGKGYTKITITTDKAITIVPRTQQLGTSSSTTASKPAQTTSSKPSTAATSQKTAQQKAAEEKAKQEQAKKAQLAAQQKAKEEAAKKAAAEKAKQEQARKAQLAAQQRAKEEAAKKAAEQAKLAQAEKKQPIEVLENEINTGKNANITPPENDAVLDSQINENLKNNKKYAKKQKNKVVDTDDGSQSFISGLKNVKTLIDNHNLNLWKLLLLAGAITFPIIVIMLILGLDKKINKRIESSFKKEEDYTSNVGISPSEQGSDEMPLYGTFDDAMSDTEQSVQNRQNLNVPPVAPIVEPNQEFNNDYEDTDFEHNFEQSEVTEPYNDPVPTEMDVDSDVIPPIAQDTNLTESEQQNIPQEEFTPPAEAYNPDGYLSEYSGVSDKDFFDELVLQSMAEENKNGLPEELPADEIFKFMSDNETQTNNNDVDDVVIVHESVVEETQNMSEDTIINEFAEEGSEPSTQASDDNLTMLTEVKLSDSTGLYLVNYDNFSSLVGHINDDYFVIKKFNNIVNGNIILKPTEQLDNATRYLVRVGKSKMVVEVSDKSMSKLIDL